MPARREIFATDRLIFCDMEIGDHHDLYRMFQEVPPTPAQRALSIEAVHDLVEKIIEKQREPNRNWFQMTVLSKETSAVIGFARAWEGAFLPRIGLTLFPEFQAKGSGTEIFRGLIDFAFKTFPSYPALQSTLDPQNIPSLRLHFKCGMQPFCFTKDGFIEGGAIEDSLEMRLTRTHFEQFGSRKAAPSLD